MSTAKRSDKSTDNNTDKIDYLVDQAHKIFNSTSIFEVCDLPYRQAAVNFLNETYSNPDHELINRYLDIVDQLTVDIRSR